MLLVKRKQPYLVCQSIRSFSYLKAEINAGGGYQLVALLTFPLCLPSPNFKQVSQKCNSNIKRDFRSIYDLVLITPRLADVVNRFKMKPYWAEVSACMPVSL